MRFTKIKIFWWKLTSRKRRKLIKDFQRALNAIPEEKKRELAEMFWSGFMRRKFDTLIKEFGYFLVEFEGPFNKKWQGDLVDRQDVDDAFETFVTHQEKITYNIEKNKS